MERTFDFYKSIDEIKQTAYDDMAGSWWYCAKLTMLAFFLCAIVASGVVVLCVLYPIWYVMASSIFVGCFLIYTLMYGYQNFFLNFACKLSSKFSDLFAGFKKIFKLFAIFVMKIFISVFGLALLVVPFFIFESSYTMSSFCLADDGKKSAREVLHESKRLMNENKKRISKLSFKNIGWLLLCLTIIGAFWALPYIYSTKAIFYNDLKTTI